MRSAERSAGRSAERNAEHNAECNAAAEYVQQLKLAQKVDFVLLCICLLFLFHIKTKKKTAQFALFPYKTAFFKKVWPKLSKQSCEIRDLSYYNASPY